MMSKELAIFDTSLLLLLLGLASWFSENNNEQDDLGLGLI